MDCNGMVGFLDKRKDIDVILTCKNRRVIIAISGSQPFLEMPLKEEEIFQRPLGEISIDEGLESGRRI